MTFVPYDRPVRAAFVGLGRIYDLNVRAYGGTPTSRLSRSLTPIPNVGPNAKPTGPRRVRSPQRPS